MRDYHANEHRLPAALGVWVETVERCSTVYRPPNFTMLESYRDARRRKLLANAFGLGLGAGVMLGVIAAVAIVAINQL